MKLAVRGKLFATSVAVVLVAVVPSGVYLENELRAETEARIQADLLKTAELARVRLEGSTTATFDLIADQLGLASKQRITIIAKDGVVLGDSGVSTEALSSVENHGARIEVIDALAGKTGVTRRVSTTVHQPMLYVAIPFHDGVVRAAMPLEEVELAASRLRTRFVLAGLFAILLAAAMSAYASHQFSTALRELVHRARGIAGGGNTLLPEPHDELGGLAGSLNRISTALERTVTELRAERDRLRAVLEGVSEAVIVVDEAGRITLANRAASTLLAGGNPLIGNTILEVLRSPALKTLVDRTRKAPTEEIEIDLPGPPERRVVARATLEKSARECVIVLVDVTKIRRLETVRRDFVANVSHELRTPVSVVSANAETLLDGALDDREAAKRFVEAIARNAVRLNNLISDLLDLSRIEAGQYAIDFESIEIDRLTKRIAEPFGKLAEAKQIKIAIDVAPDLEVRGDERAIEQVLSNLLENAVKYTEPGGCVEVHGASVDGFVRIEVADNGPGIEPQHRSRIFERFYRVDPGRSRENGGTGLGLSIAKHLVDALGGEIGIEPREPRGSRFWVRLPAVAE